MNRLRIISSTIFLIGLVFSCERRLCGCDPGIESPLNGNWNLTHITYGLTQKTVTAAEAGYSETLIFTNFGSYRRERNGTPVHTSDYSYSSPSGGTTEGIIHFLADTTQQSFRIVDSNLSLSERTPRGAVLADGSTYTYQRE